MNETHRLLREYVESGSEPAFRELVGRYIDLVYSTAIRRVSGDVHRAEDVVQTVFTDLARKAAHLPVDVMLGGWLHRHCCFVASNVQRAESRRSAREQEAALMTAFNASNERDWEQLSPVLDEAIQELVPDDRDALILRFFERQNLRSIGATLGTSEDAAQKRVSRALEKLRHLLSERGVVLSLGVLDGLLVANSVSAAPTDWAGRIGNTALESIPIKAGLLAAAFGLFSSTGLKIAATGILLASGLLWQWPNVRDFIRHAPAPPIDKTQLVEGVTPSATPSPTLPSAQVSAETSAIDATTLKLVILAADTLQPLANVPIEYRAYSGDRSHRKDLTSGADGICAVPFPDEPLTRLQLTTRMDGYADTRLLWHVDRGQKIPEGYTLKLSRATLISGSVVDAHGDPVGGAKVGFNHDEDPAQSSQVESRLFSWIEVESDVTGRWKINRIADELIRSLRGGASHPEHVGSHFDVSRDPASEEQLRNGTHVLHLGSAVTVRGVVMDSGGTPIPQANVLVGPLGYSGSRKAVTELDGTFEAKGCTPGKTLITAAAPQYAPTTIGIEARTNSEPVRLVLARGKILKLRIVNQNGNPIPKAQVWLNTLRHDRRSPGDPPAPISQADFNPKADADGRVSWDQAPDEELTFSFAATGFMRSDDVKIRPDGSEHAVVLQPALTVHGTVRDAENGDSIPAFKLISGWPQMNFNEDKITPNWGTMDRDWISFAGGKFQRTYEEPPLGGVKDPEFIFKIEAEGFAPFVTRVVKANEGVVTFDVLLQKAKSLSIQVLQPDGTPAPNTGVSFAAPMEHVLLTGNGFDPHNSGMLLTTDKSGRLNWQPDGNVVAIYAANTRGFAEVLPANLLQDSKIALQPWGRAEITFQKRGKPVEGRGISIDVPNRQQQKPFLRIGDPVTTDSQGKVTIPRIPVGKYDVVYLSPSSSSGERSYTHVPFAEIEIRAGETAFLNYNETGVEVLVRPVWPPGVPHEKDERIFAHLRTTTPLPPAEILQDPAALKQWAQTPEVKESHMKARHYPFGEKEPNCWSTSEVPPGDYTLSFMVGRPIRQGEPPRPPVQGSKQITIPDDLSSEVFDAGDLPLELVKTRSQSQP